MRLSRARPTGVSFCRKSGKYSVSFTYKGGKYIGTFAEEDVAGRAYDTVVRRYFVKPHLTFTHCGDINPHRFDHVNKYQ